MKFALLALSMPLAGCISVLPKPPPAPLVFPLAAADAPAPSVAASPIVIAVERPGTPRALSGADIVWMKDGHIAYIDGVTWDGRAPDQLQTLLVRTIDRSGGAKGAVRAGEGHADSILSLDLAEFGIVEDGGLEARFTGHANLFTPRDRRLIAALEINEHEPLKDRSSSAAAAALQGVARTAATKLATWAAAQTPLPTAEAAAPVDRPRTGGRRRP